MSSQKNGRAFGGIISGYFVKVLYIYYRMRDAIVSFFSLKRPYHAITMRALRRPWFDMQLVQFH